jgi:23S rRNA (uracil1939-C5)-methyltransferase
MLSKPSPKPHSAAITKGMSGDLLIHELGPKGDGVHRSRSGTVYVDRALPGDIIQATVGRDVDGILRGDLLKVIRASPHRVKAPCPNYNVCGGCTLQHAKDEFYRHWKVDIVRNALRSKGLKPRVWRDPVFLTAADRRRATFAAYKKNNIVTLGNYRRRAHQVTDIASCLVVDPAVMAMRERLKTLLALILQEGNAASVFIQAVDGQFDIVITGAVGRTGKPDLQTRQTVAQFARATNANRISWRANPDDDAEIIIELSPPRARFGGLEIILPPQAFLQPTQAGEDALVASVMALLPRTGKFADLFSGCGTFTGPMLERGAVDAYESVGSAVRALDKAKGTRPLKAIRRDLFRNPLRRDEANRYDAIVFDPPRAGAQEQVRILASGRTPLLVGVSCNPATFARDAHILVDGGYRLDSVRVVDQFTWSHHVELVAAFTKRPR